MCGGVCIYDALCVGDTTSLMYSSNDSFRCLSMSTCTSNVYRCNYYCVCVCVPSYNLVVYSTTLDSSTRWQRLARMRRVEGKEWKC